MRIAIVGAGVAGLQVARRLCEEHMCYVFDERDGPGGLWRSNYDGYGLQVPSELYEFVSLPSESQHGTFPQGRTVLAYIERYLEHTHVEDRCRMHYGTRVVGIERMGSEWRISTTHGDENASFAVDYCVVCTGMYNVPNVPACLAGDERVVHSSRFVDASVVRGKKVVVVGAGKSAIDCALASCAHAKEVRIISRRVHWPVPRKIGGCIPFKWATYSRLGAFLLPMHWSVSERERYWHVALEWLKNLVWGLMELVVRLQFPTTPRPLTPLVIDLFGHGQVLAPDFSEALERGSIKWSLCSAGEDIVEAVADADTIVCGTGFSKSYDIFDESVRRELDIAEDGLWLYKNMLPPKVPNLAFVGSEVSTFNNVLTHYLQAEWLADTLSKAPMQGSAMCAYIECEKTWKRRLLPFSTSRASLLQLHMTTYHDILQRDMRRPLVRNRWFEWVLPIDAESYRKAAATDAIC